MYIAEYVAKWLSNGLRFYRCSAAVAQRPMKAKEVASLCITNTYTKAWSLGHAVLQVSASFIYKPTLIQSLGDF
jgi:hypothetical protein